MGKADDNDNGAIVMPAALPHCVWRVSFRIFSIRRETCILEWIFVIPVLVDLLLGSAIGIEIELTIHPEVEYPFYDAC